MVRKSKNKPILPVILIICEGEKTEINYFEGLRSDVRLRTFKIQPQNSEDNNALGIIEYTIGHCQKKDISSKNGDLIYCVFDRDNNTNNELEKAIKLANKNNFQIIFSNPNIEYWILSHFEYLKTNCEKDELNRKLNNYFPESYEKNNKEIYKFINSKIDVAINNCKKIEKEHINKEIKIISRESNPSSQVYQVIEKVKSLK